MSEVFEGRNLADAVFWGVDLQRSVFRDADMSKARFFHTLWKDASIDGVIEQLVVNGVDVTNYVNEHDRWFPLRTQLEPSTADELRTVWVMVQQEWSRLLDSVSQLDPEAVLRSVDGQWSLRDTLRHLVFATDKWFTCPVLNESTYNSVGLPNTESQDRAWPGIDRDADPSFRHVLDVRAETIERFTTFISAMEFAELPDYVDVDENGRVSPVMCFHVVLEEEFEHLRYALRDVESITRWDSH